MSNPNGASMVTKRMAVTPDIATKWLESDKAVHHNRPLKDAKVEQYAKDMRDGRWMENHQGIAFGPDGEILDGQHRLWAVVMSSCTISFLVTFNMPPEAQRTVDDHIKRSVVDILSVEAGGTAGIVENLHAAIANRMMHGNRHLQVPTRQETLAYLTRHFEAIDFAIAGVKRKKIRGITKAPVLAPVARAWYSHNHDRLNAFLGVLMTGDYESRDRDQPARVLREFLIRNLTSRSRSGPELIYSKTERALYAFLKGENMIKLYEASEELFPIATDSRRVTVPSSAKTRSLARLKAEAV